MDDITTVALDFEEVAIEIDGYHVGDFRGSTFICVSPGEDIEDAYIDEITLTAEPKPLVLERPYPDEISDRARLFRMLVRSILDDYRYVIADKLHAQGVRSHAEHIARSERLSLRELL